MSELKKILIRAPKKKSEAVSTFPLIHKVREEYPNSQIHIIHDQDHSGYYSSFPFETFTYEFNEEDVSLPGIHKYAVNQNEIFNIDIYFDLSGSFKSAFLGFSFRAKERVGYVSGLNKLFLTQKVEPFTSYRPDRVHLKLLEVLLEKDFSEVKINGAERSEQLKSNNIEELVNLPDYFFVDSNRLKKDREFWNDFFRFFEDQYFVIWFDSTQGEEEYESIVQMFKEKEQKNVYLVKTGPQETFLRLLVHSIGYITDNLNWSYIANYLGVPTYSLVQKATDLPFMEHFERSPFLIELKDGYPVKWIGPEESEAMETVDSLVNRLHDLHKL